MSTYNNILFKDFVYIVLFSKYYQMNFQTLKSADNGSIYMYTNTLLTKNHSF